ncbi:MAG: hypothetical protein Q8882_01880 [Bacillota bacterium]|nr:hypothetical protein [Bacillota bacterium]
MKAKSHKMKVTSGILAGVMLLSVGTISYAANSKSGKENVCRMSKTQMVQKNGQMDKVDFKAKLAQLVTAGSITQEQSNKIAAYMENEQAAMKAEHEKLAAMTEAERKAYFEENKNTSKTERKDMFACLVTDGTLTQAQADLVVKALMPEGRGGHEGKCGLMDAKRPKLTEEQMEAKMEEQKAEMTEGLAQAVTNGTITQATSDKLAAYIDKKDAECKTQMMEQRNKTSDNKKVTGVKPSANAFHKGYKMQGLFEGAVTDGIITAEQSKAITDILRARQEAAKEEAIETKLANIVTAGTITQEQADKVVAALDQQKADKKAEQEKLAAMTEAERKAYFEVNKGANKPEKTKPLASLISDGTITQEQAYAIMKAIM